MHQSSPTGLAFAVALLVSLACSARPSGAAPPETNEARAARAMRAREAGDYPAAIRILEEVVKVEPRPGWLGLLAETYAWEKRFEEAERIYRNALKRFPLSRDLELGLSRVLAWQGRYPEARVVLVRLVDRKPGDIDALESLGLVSRGLFRSAVRTFRTSWS